MSEKEEIVIEIKELRMKKISMKREMFQDKNRLRHLYNSLFRELLEEQRQEFVDSGFDCQQIREKLRLINWNAEVTKAIGSL